MNTQQVAHRLIELCRLGKFSQALDKLYVVKCSGRDSVKTSPAAIAGPRNSAER